MADLMRYTVFGQLLRLVSRGRLLPWPEQTNPSLVEKYLVNEPDTVTRTPHPGARRQSADTGRLGSRSESESTSTLSATSKIDEDGITGMRGLEEKGQDRCLVDWYENDPEVY